MIGFWDNKMKLDVDHCQKKIFEQLEEEQNSEFDLKRKAASYFLNFYEYSVEEED